MVGNGGADGCTEGAERYRLGTVSEVGLPSRDVRPLSSTRGTREVFASIRFFFFFWLW